MAVPDNKNKDCRKRIRTGHGKQVAVRAQIQHIQEQIIEPKQRGGSQNAIHRNQTVQHAGTDELGAERAQAAHQYTGVNQNQIIRRIGDQPHQRPADRH